MKILAFESSCDETAVAVVEDGRRVLSDAIASQVDIHAIYGGVVPEIASRKHVECIAALTEKALADQFHHLNVTKHAVGNGWRPPIQKVIASQNEGITETIENIEKHFKYISENGILAQRRTERAKNEILDVLHSNVGNYITRKLTATGEMDRIIEKIKARETDPYTVVANIMQDMLK